MMYFLYRSSPYRASVAGKEKVMSSFHILSENLLSVAQMRKNGYSLVFGNGHCSIYDPGNKEIAKVAMENKTFSLKWSYNEERSNRAQTSETWLWHRRYGHFNLRALADLHKHGVVRDFPAIHITKELCEPCQLGKQDSLPFPKGQAWRAKGKLELVHTDVCGPQRRFSHYGKRYFILFIDDFTRMTWLYFMKEKSEVFQVFKKFKALVENQSGCKLKMIRSDRGKE